MTLTAVANDSHGAPVLDLRSSELRLLDNNKEEKIASFQINAGHDRRMTVLVFDQLNMGWAAQARSGSALLKLVQDENAEETPNLALYLINSQGNLLPVRSISDTRPGEALGPDFVLMLERDLRKIQRVPSELVTDDGRRFDVTAGALQGLISQLLGEAGLRNVLWVTGGISIVNFRAEARKLAAEFNLVNAPLSVLDVGAGGMGRTNFGVEKDLASLTGGRAISGLDIKSALERAHMDLRSTYEITYAPKLENWDNTYHNIRLVCGRPKISLRYKQVYFARRPF